MALSDSLVSYWSLDEASGNALDAHGANELTDNNTVGTATGKVSNARDIEADNTEFFSRADNTDLSAGDIDFTFAFWINLESKPVSNSDIIVKLNGSDGEYVITHIAGSDRFAFRVWGASGFGSQTEVVANSLGAPSLATWYFIVVWHDATANTINIQVDDGTVDSNAHTAGVFDGTGEFRIGRASDFSSNMDGLVDEVGFWKRVLTSEERTELYNSGAGRDYAYITGGAGEVVNIVPLLMRARRLRAA